jgi:hypothetical protein
MKNQKVQKCATKTASAVQANAGAKATPAAESAQIPASEPEKNNEAIAGATTTAEETKTATAAETSDKKEKEAKVQQVLSGGDKAPENGVSKEPEDEQQEQQPACTVFIKETPSKNQIEIIFNGACEQEKFNDVIDLIKMALPVGGFTVLETEKENKLNNKPTRPKETESEEKPARRKKGFGRIW